MKQQKLFFLSLCFLLCTLFSSAQNIDIKWLDKINSPVNSSYDKPWKLISNSVVPISLATPITLFTVGLATHDKELRTKSYEAGVSFLLATALSSSLKIAFKRPRPFTTYPDIITKKSDGGSYSFPSGHTTAAFATATSLTLAFPKWYVAVPAYTYAAAVAYSRMYLGVHYPSDVLGGMIIGIGSSLLVFQVQKWMDKK